MTIKPLYIPKKEPMRVAGFMSGSGTNLRRILEQERSLKPSPYRVVLVFSDTEGSNSRIIADEYGVQHDCRDIREFYKEKKADRKDMKVREEYDRKTAELLRTMRIDVVALCGYMSIVTAPIYDSFVTLNVHPADLTKMEKGKRKYAGLMGKEAVKAAMLAGDNALRSSVHVVTKDVDYGPVLMASEPVRIDRAGKEDADAAAERYLGILKEKGDWVVYPKALRLLAEGRIGMENGMVYVDGERLQ